MLGSENKSEMMSLEFDANSLTYSRAHGFVASFSDFVPNANVYSRILTEDVVQVEMSGPSWTERILDSVE